MHSNKPTEAQDMHQTIFLKAVNASEDAVLLIDNTNNQFIECNDAAVRMLHARNKQEVLFAHPWELSPERQPDGRSSEEKSIEMNAIAERKKFHRFEWNHLRMDGEEFPVEVTLTTIRLDHHNLLHVVWRDLSHIKQIERARDRIFRAKSMLSSSNHALVRSRNENELLNSICDIAVKVGGYSMAWIGYKQEDALQSVTPMAKSGIEDGYLESTRISWGDNEFGAGPTGLAIRSGRLQYIQNLQADPHFSHWRSAASERGFGASIALPLLADGTAFGALTIYAKHTDAFDAQEIPILEELTGDLSYGVLTLRNDQVRKHTESELNYAHSLLRTALEATADGLLVTTLDGKMETCNQQFIEMLGIPPHIIASKRNSRLVEYIAQQTRNPIDFLDQVRTLREAPELEHDYTFTLRDGRIIERITRPQMMGEQIIGRVCSFRDISAQKKHEKELTYLANHDALTALPNRTLLLDRLDQAIAHAHRTGSTLAVMFFDLDRFKLINDSMGHDVGDQLLLQISQRLPDHLHEGDTAARMGGDEFIVLLNDIVHEEDAALIATKLLEAIALPVLIKQREFFSSSSIGISLYPRDGADSATLVKHADAAMYHAKGRGGNCYQFFTAHIHEQIARKLDLADQLRHAIARNEFEIHYQPQIDIGCRQLVGAEALIRWRHPEMGMVSPAEFIPVAEETGMISHIGNWVTETACGHIKAWQQAGLPDIRVAINLSARQFDSGNLVETLSGILERNGIAAQLLELEITEGLVMQHPERAVSVLNELNALGFKIAIDDFGTGYSSLAYLKRFPIDKLKIDRAFIMDVITNPDDAAITRALIVMAHELKIKVVAEGVETDEQLAFLLRHRCDYVQGYLTGRPVPLSEFTVLLRDSADEEGT